MFYGVPSIVAVINAEGGNLVVLEGEAEVLGRIEPAFRIGVIVKILFLRSPEDILDLLPCSPYPHAAHGILRIPPENYRFHKFCLVVESDDDLRVGLLILEIVFLGGIGCAECSQDVALCVAEFRDAADLRDLEIILSVCVDDKQCRDKSGRD